jgi:hypothetical protein
VSSAHMRMLNAHRSRQSLKDKVATKSDPSHVGLCLDCLHAKQVEGKEDTFYFLCELSFTNRTFPKYPRLPVLRCPGYVNRRA